MLPPCLVHAPMQEQRHAKLKQQHDKDAATLTLIQCVTLNLILTLTRTHHRPSQLTLTRTLTGDARDTLD